MNYITALIGKIKQCVINSVVIIVYICRSCQVPNNKKSTLIKSPCLIGHGKYQCEHLDNSISLYRYLIEILRFDIIECDVLFTKDNVPVLSHDSILMMYDNGEQVEINVANYDYGYLNHLSRNPDNFEPLLTLEELLVYIRTKGKAIMLDMLHTKMTFTRTRILFNLVKKNSLLKKTIWADGNWKYLYLLNPSLILQLETPVWNGEGFKRVKRLRCFSGLIINSCRYNPENQKNYKQYIENCHKNNIYTKVYGVNKSDIAKNLFDLGVDFIITDKLRQ